MCAKEAPVSWLNHLGHLALATAAAKVEPSQKSIEPKRAEKVANIGKR